MSPERQPEEDSNVRRRRVLIPALLAVGAVVLMTTAVLIGWLGGTTGADKKTAAVPPNLGAEGPKGCSYLFHSSLRYQVVAGVWEGQAFRWDKRPQQQGRWTAEQQRAVRENATVGTGGLLMTGHPGSLSNCFRA